MAVPREEHDPPVVPSALGKYLLLEQVARGRTASVHRAVVQGGGGTASQLAIKRFTAQLSADADFTDAFARVMARVAQIDHAAHCALQDADRAGDGTLFAAFDWVHGCDLKRIARALRERGMMMPPALIAFIGAQVAEVLAVAHELSLSGKRAQLLHGELSPLDILVGFDGGVRLIGLGSAELAMAAQVPASRLAYQAPEIELGTACSPQSDVFSLGACLYQVLSFTPEDADQTGSADGRRLNSHITQIIPQPLKQIMSQALAQQPKARFGSARELARALQEWSSRQSRPGNAEALAAFVRELLSDEQTGRASVPASEPPSGLVERAKNDPWSGREEQTPANNLLTTRLAAEMVEPTPREQAAESAEHGAAAFHHAVGDAVGDAVVEPPKSEAELAKSARDDDPWDDDTTHDHPWLASFEPEGLPATSGVRPRAVAPEAQAQGANRAPLRAAVPAPAMAPSPFVAPPARSSAMTPPPVSQPVLTAWRDEPRTSRRAMVVAGACGLVLVAVVVAMRETRNDDESAAAVRAPAREAAARSDASGASTASAIPKNTQPVRPTTATATAAAKPDLAERNAARGTPSSAPARNDDPQTARDGERPREARGHEPEPTPRAEPAAATQPLPEVTTPVLDREPPDAVPSPPIQTLPAVTAGPASPAADEQPAPASPQTSGTASVAEEVASAAPQVRTTPAARIAEADERSGPTRAPVLVEQNAPRFPRRAQRMGVTEGVVVIEFTVDERGRVQDAAVVSADPPRVFESAALDAIRTWRYEPGLVNGDAKASRQRFTFRFR